MAKTLKNKDKKKQKPTKAAIVSHSALEIGYTTEPCPYDGTPIAVAKNVRESPLELLRSRHLIDLDHYQAGSRFRSLFERSQLGNISAMDVARPKVDAGNPQSSLSDRQLQAHRLLADVARTVGPEHYTILKTVVGAGISVGSVVDVLVAQGHRRTQGDKRLSAMVTAAVVDALDALLDVWQMRAKGKKTRRSEFVRAFDLASQSTAAKLTAPKDAHKKTA